MASAIAHNLFPLTRSPSGASAFSPSSASSGSSGGSDAAAGGTLLSSSSASHHVKSDDTAAKGIKKIVQCPQCATRYLVDDASLHNATTTHTLRFHCSRCDGVFTCGDYNTLATQPLSQRDTPFFSSTTTLSTPTPNTSPPSNSFHGASSQTLIGSPSSTHREESPPRATILSLQSLGRSSAAPSSTTRPESSTPSHLQRAAPRNDSPATTTPPTVPTSPSRGTTLSSPSSPPQPPTRHSFDQEGARSHDLRILPTSILLVPLLCIMLTVGALATWFSTESAAVERFIDTFFVSVPRSAPPSLMVRVAKFRALELDNGEIIPLVLGEVHNRSTGTFSEVRIEATLFDREGGVIARKVGLAPNRLASSKLRSLSVNAILAMEKNRPSKDTSMNPLERVRFVIPFSPDEGRTAVSFATRIYSAERR